MQRKRKNKTNRIAKGALAHLARAFDWQSRGDEFESRMLHVRNNINIRNALSSKSACWKVDLELVLFNLEQRVVRVN